MNESRSGTETREEFICERCNEPCDDPSYQPLCPDCYWDTADEDAEERAR